MLVFTLGDIISLVLFGIFIFCLIIIGLMVLYGNIVDWYNRKRKKRG